MLTCELLLENSACSAILKLFMRLTVLNRVVDPDPVTLWIRIGNPDSDPGARKLRNFGGKMHFSFF
jgi:hypothetical protein